MTLAGTPHGQPVTGRPPCGGVLRLNVSLMDRLGGVLSLENLVCLLESSVRVAQDVASMRRHVAATGQFGIIGPRIVERHSVLCHRVCGVGVRRKNLVLHVNQREQALSDMGVGRGDGGNRMAFVQNFVSGQKIL